MVKDMGEEPKMEKALLLFMFSDYYLELDSMLIRPDGGGLALHRFGSSPHRSHPSTADSHSTIISTITRFNVDRKEVTPLDSRNEQIKAEERQSSSRQHFIRKTRLL